jgi:hypothetical protein
MLITPFVILVSGCALLVLAAAGAPADQGGKLATWLLACIAGEAFWIRTPTRRGIISMALTIDLAAIFTLSPAGSLMVIGASTLVAGIFPHRRSWYKVLFNAGQATVAASAAVSVVSLLQRDQEAGSALSLGMTWIPLFAAGIIYYLVNSGLVSSAIALSSGASFWRSWRDNYGYGFELWCTLAQISLAGFVLVAYQQMGPLAVFLLLPVLGVLWWSSAREAQARSTSTTDETGEPEELRKAS